MFTRVLVMLALVPAAVVMAEPAQAHTRPTNGFSRQGPWNTKLPRHVPSRPTPPPSWRTSASTR
ncbi:hypothetical protein [Dactylosporangium cerinum]